MSGYPHSCRTKYAEISFLPTTLTHICSDEMDDGGSHDGSHGKGDQVVPQAQNSRLWVDLYSPKSYIDLMSDEVICSDIS